MEHDENALDLLDAADDQPSVPADFPRPIHLAAIGGAQPKLLLSRHGGRYYAPGATPPELHKRWRLCEDIAEHLRGKSLESKAGKRSHMSETEILDQYLVRLIATGWVSEPEARWVIRRIASLLEDWPIPENAKEPAFEGCGESATRKTSN